MITLPVTCDEIKTALKLLGLACLGGLWYAGIFEGIDVALASAFAVTLILAIFAFVFEGERVERFITRNIRCKCDDTTG